MSMWDYIGDKLKAFGAWVWTWVTVIVAATMGLLSVGVDFFNSLTGVDFVQLVGAQRSMQIVAAVAFAKALVATYKSKMQP
jgi:hypothetical protein